MVTQTSSQLSHEEAFELLPWHVNATLEEPLSEQVAEHLEQCPTCREESAMLSNTILAVNTGDAVAANVDARFSKVLERVRHYEASNSAALRADSPPLIQRVAAWLGVAQPRMQWASAFTVGLAVGIGALIIATQMGDLGGDPQTIYETHSTGRAPMRLQVEFEQPPQASLLAELEQAVGKPASWRQQSATHFVIELPEDLTVKSVTDIRARLLADDAVVSVAVDLGNPDDPESD